MSVMWIRTQSSNTIDAFRRGMVLFTATILFALALVPSLATTPIPTFGDDVIPAGRKADTVAIISIHGPIDGITRHSLERRLEAAVAEGADAVVLEIDTPGGDLQATFEILELIRTKAPSNTIAWIRPRAFSAGTIIALATREIVTTPTGVFGDAAPIRAMPLAGLQKLPAAERAKIEAPLLSELVSDARRQGWDEKLVQAFVAVDIELWLIRNRETGDRLFVDAAEYERIYGEPPVATRVQRLPAPPARDEATGLLTGPARVEQGETPTNKAERDLAIEFVQEMPSRRPVLGPEAAEDWVSLGQVVSSDELLVLQADEALAYGFSSGTIADETELQTFLGSNTTIRLDETWSESMVRLLTLWPVRAVLIAAFLIGFFLEAAAPGYGIFGLIALVSLSVLLGAPLLTGLSDWWTIVAVVIGLGLVALELFFLPGIGFVGVLGGLCIFAGLVGTFVSGDPFSPEARNDLLRGIGTTSIGMIAAGVGIWLAWRSLPHTKLGRGFILSAEIGGEQASEGPAKSRHRTDQTPLITPGSIGRTTTPLRTAGRVEFDGRIVDARSTGAFIDVDIPVRVVDSDRFGVLVETLES